MDAGLHTLPLAIMTIIASPLSGRLVAGRGTRLPLRIAGTAMALGMLPMTWADATTPMWQPMLGHLLFGFGFGMVNTPITNTAVSGMPRARAGVAAAIASTSRQVGSALGVAVTGAVLTSTTATAAVSATAASAGPAATDAASGAAGWWILFALGLAVLAIGHITSAPGPGPRRPAPQSPLEKPLFLYGWPSPVTPTATPTGPPAPSATTGLLPASPPTAILKHRPPHPVVNASRSRRRTHPCADLDAPATWIEGWRIRIHANTVGGGWRGLGSPGTGWLGGQSGGE